MTASASSLSVHLVSARHLKAKTAGLGVVPFHSERPRSHTSPVATRGQLWDRNATGRRAGGQDVSGWDSETPPWPNPGVTSDPDSGAVAKITEADVTHAPGPCCWSSSVIFHRKAWRLPGRGREGCPAPRASTPERADLPPPTGRSGSPGSTPRRPGFEATHCTRRLILDTAAGERLGRGRKAHPGALTPVLPTAPPSQGSGRSGARRHSWGRLPRFQKVTNEKPFSLLAPASHPCERALT